MSAQVIAALLARADQLDEQAAGRRETGDPQPPDEWPQQSPALARWLAGELRAVARIAQEPG